MNNEQWRTSVDALEMLKSLKENSSEEWEALTPVLHRYYLECCKKIDYLLPQKHIQAGLKGGDEFLDGKIDLEELRRLEWHAEAQAFIIDYGVDEQNTRRQIESTFALNGMKYEEAWALIKAAAYFADRAIIYSFLRSPKRLPKSNQFLCPYELRKLVPAPFNE